MATPLGGPGFGFGYQPNPPPSSTTATLTSGSTAVTGMVAPQTLTQGQRVLSPGVSTPSFVAANVTSSSTFTLDKAATASGAGQAVSFLPWPVLLGGEFTGALASGDTLSATYWNGTGIFNPENYQYQPLCDLQFIIGAGGVTFGDGARIAIYLRRSYDFGASFEPIVATSSPSVPPLARSPDAIIRFSAGAYTQGQFVSVPLQLNSNFPFIPALYNASGVGLPAGSALIMAQGGPNY